MSQLMDLGMKEAEINELTAEDIQEILEKIRAEQKKTSTGTEDLLAFMAPVATGGKRHEPKVGWHEVAELYMLLGSSACVGRCRIAAPHHKLHDSQSCRSALECRTHDSVCVARAAKQDIQSSALERHKCCAPTYRCVPCRLTEPLQKDPSAQNHGDSSILGAVEAAHRAARRCRGLSEAHWAMLVRQNHTLLTENEV